MIFVHELLRPNTVSSHYGIESQLRNLVEQGHTIISVYPGTSAWSVEVVTEKKEKDPTDIPIACKHCRAEGFKSPCRIIGGPVEECIKPYSNEKVPSNSVQNVMTHDLEMGTGVLKERHKITEIETWDGFMFQEYPDLQNEQIINLFTRIMKQQDAIVEHLKDLEGSHD